MKLMEMLKLIQKFLIETKEGVDEAELLGCLEDTISDNIIAVKEIDVKR